MNGIFLITSSNLFISQFVFQFVDQNSKTSLTKEFYTILNTIKNSPYYTNNPAKACIFVPSIDTLNQNRFDVNLVGKALASLDYWENDGENHLLFNMISGEAPDFNTGLIDVNTGKALVASAGFDTWSYRFGFDLSLPFYSPLLETYKPQNPTESLERSYLLIAPQLNMFARHNRLAQEISYEEPSSCMLLQKCSTPEFIQKVKEFPELAEKDIRCTFPANDEVQYPEILEKGIFCLIARGVRLAQPSLLESLAAGCIPVVMADNIIMPFQEIVDWSLASITIRESDLHSVMTVLKSVSSVKIQELQKQGKFLYDTYFSSLEKIVLTMLDELNDRVYPHLSKTYNHWNLPHLPGSSQNPLFLPMIASKSQGFTAVVLTYDRIDSLFILIQKLSNVSSLQKILVIWNNQKKAPPHMSLFPKIAKPLKVIQTKFNKLSNRFYPYEEIETEAILSIDDDIVMLTADELDFGFEVWREFPDRIIGFPSRTHVWDNSTNRWKYESEWTNDISMVLTGAAFYHKYWNYMYTNHMPGEIKEFVDERFNCEDIAMNFLVSNVTNKPPIKVTPRKKFKCPECSANEMLSMDLGHMLERTECINKFTEIYGAMPLKSGENLEIILKILRESL